MRTFRKACKLFTMLGFSFDRYKNGLTELYSLSFNLLEIAQNRERKLPFTLALISS